MTRLTEKAARIDLNIDDEDVVPPPTPTSKESKESVFHGETPPAPRSRTGVGMVTRAMNSERALREENQSLRGQVAALEDGSKVLPLDPMKVHPGRYANRHETAYSRMTFASLKEEIATAGRNVQPIKVRPHPQKPSEFEIVFGHRRHRACLELGLPVFALIENVTEQELFIQMDRENRERQDLSPWEQGVMYKRALDSGLFASLRQMASAIGASASNVSKAMSTAELPAAVVQAFSSPLDIQFRWAALLKDALERDAHGVEVRAKELAASPGGRAPREVLEALLAKPQAESPVTSFEINGKTVGEFKQARGGAVQVSFKAGALTPGQVAKLKKFAEELLSRK